MGSLKFYFDMGSHYGSSPQRQVKISENYATALLGGGTTRSKCFSFHFSSTFYLLFAAAVEKVHSLLRKVRTNRKSQVTRSSNPAFCSIWSFNPAYFYFYGVMSSHPAQALLRNWQPPQALRHHTQVLRRHGQPLLLLLCDKVYGVICKFYSVMSSQTSGIKELY